MNKYVVKNCPMYFCTNCYGHTGTAICEDFTDCLIKQVIEKCKQSLNYSSKEPYELGRTNMAGIILAYFEIEECE